MRNAGVTKNITTFVIAHYEKSCELWRSRPIILFCNTLYNLMFNDIIDDSNWKASELGLLDWEALA